MTPSQNAVGEKGGAMTGKALERVSARHTRTDWARAHSPPKCRGLIWVVRAAGRAAEPSYLSAERSAVRLNEMRPSRL